MPIVTRDVFNVICHKADHEDMGTLTDGGGVIKENIIMLFDETPHTGVILHSRVPFATKVLAGIPASTAVVT
eukprot:5227826-Heterocapsa_arctica.AAC.1